MCYQCRFEAAFIPPLGTATLLTLSPSDCGAMRLPAHQMALIASDCVGTGPAPARKPCRLGLEMEATDRYVHVSQTLELRANDISGDVQTMFRAANRRSAAAPLAPPPGAAVSVLLSQLFLHTELRGEVPYVFPENKRKTPLLPPPTLNFTSLRMVDPYISGKLSVSSFRKYICWPTFTRAKPQFVTQGCFTNTIHLATHTHLVGIG